MQNKTLTFSSYIRVTAATVLVISSLAKILERLLGTNTAALSALAAASAIVTLVSVIFEVSCPNKIKRPETPIPKKL